MTVTIRNFQANDTEAVVALICRTLREVNSRDYPMKEMEGLARKHTPEAIVEMAKQGRMLVAFLNGMPAGVLCVLPSRDTEKEFWLRTVFVQPESQGVGIGTALVKAGEERAREQGGETVRLCASRTAHSFYQRLEYRDLTRGEDAGGLYPMQKRL